MKIFVQLGILFAVCLAAEGIAKLLPFAMPASILGMLLMLLLLVTGLLKKEQLQETSGFLLGNLPIFFVPAIVGLVNYLELMWDNLGKILVVIMVSLVATFAVTVWVVRLTTALMERGKNK